MKIKTIKYYVGQSKIDKTLNNISHIEINLKVYIDSNYQYSNKMTFTAQKNNENNSKYYGLKRMCFGEYFFDSWREEENIQAILLKDFIKYSKKNSAVNKLDCEVDAFLCFINDKYKGQQIYNREEIFK